MLGCAESRATEPADSIPTPVAEPADSATAPRGDENWVRQLIANGFHINDPGIKYPRFARFCLDVYNWGDRTFNTYDTTYVVATGKNWKLKGISNNWANSYFMIFPHNTQLHMLSHINADIGGYLCFMAVSLGYSFNAREIITHQKANRRNFEFNFTCALFSGNLIKNSTKGGVTIRRFGDYNDGGRISVPLDDISNDQFSADLYYFFNHRHYAHAAAYCFSKYQLKPAGTWIVGAGFNNQNIRMNFKKLPTDMLSYLPSLSMMYHFHYTDYNIVGGYAYNWVPRPRTWLLNLTVLPSIGYKHSFEDATDGRRDMFSTSMRVMGAAVYNHRSLFASVTGRFDGYLYYTRNFTFLNSTESLTFTVGMRF